MIVGSNEKNYLFFMFMFICWLSEKKRKYKELKLAKLEFHITRNSSLVSSSMIEGKKKKKRITLEFCIYKALELRVLCCMELKVLKLEFHVAFFQ